MRRSLHKDGVYLPKQGRGINADYQNALREVVVEEISIIPIDGRDRMIVRQQLDITAFSTDIPLERAVRSKVSPLKAALKRRLF